MAIDQTKITWQIDTDSPTLKGVRDSLGDQHEALRDSIRKRLCEYFNQSEACDQRGSGISRIGATSKGGKRLKVRSPIPGTGRRGGLRLAVVAYCDEKRVLVLDAWIRKDVGDFEESFGRAQ